MATASASVWVSFPSETAWSRTFLFASALTSWMAVATVDSSSPIAWARAFAISESLSPDPDSPGGAAGGWPWPPSVAWPVPLPDG